MDGLLPGEVVRPHRNLRVLYLTYLLLVIWAGIISWLLPLAFFMPPYQTLVISTGSFLLVILILWWSGAYFRTIEYHFSSAGISWARGVFLHRSGFMPFHQIIKVDIIQGPMQRFLGIYQLKVQAGGSPADPLSGMVLKINGVTEPGRLRDYILSQQQATVAAREG
jgi:membrane protein YdbS with pleckstrin-like domain